MGIPKLLLPWGSGTLIDRVLQAWRASRVTRVVAVVHPEDHELARACAGAGAEVVQPSTPPPDMKASVRAALAHLQTLKPNPDDAWLVAPADIPGITAQRINAMIAAYESDARERPREADLWVPIHDGRRGHPILGRWGVWGVLDELGENEGLSALFQRLRVREVELSSASLDDVDTPADYERLRPASTMKAVKLSRVGTDNDQADV
jgi:molybdenum cofactor cytidylyltransferase